MQILSLDKKEKTFSLCKAKHVNNVWDCKIINHWKLLSWKSSRFSLITQAELERKPD